jgi:hypothetical protein
MVGKALTRILLSQRKVAKRKRDQIRSAGPDFYGEKKVEFPLGAIIEPMPE